MSVFMRQRMGGVVWLGLWIVCSAASEARAEPPEIRFDVSPISVATPAEPSDSAMVVPGHQLVSLSLQLSTLMPARETSVDHLMVTIRCEDESVRVADYAPRTEVGSETAGEIEVQQTLERNKHVGLNVAAHYGNFVDGSLGGEVGKKDLETLKFKRLAPVHVVAASGTVDRGRGVYFKLRSTATQILEGDKTFSLTLAVPDHWQGGLLQVSVAAEAVHRPFPGIERQVKTVGRDLFTVATFAAGDEALQAAALSLVNAEAELRSIAETYRETIGREIHPSLFQHVAAAFDTKPTALSHDWLDRVLQNDIDSRLQRELRRLPVDVRVAIMDYVDARQRFLQFGATSNEVAAQ